jgi:hypothetical protein
MFKSAVDFQVREISMIVILVITELVNIKNSKG